MKLVEIRDRFRQALGMKPEPAKKTADDYLRQLLAEINKQDWQVDLSKGFVSRKDFTMKADHDTFIGVDFGLKDSMVMTVLKRRPGNVKVVYSTTYKLKDMKL